MVDDTDWKQVWLILAAGIIGASQILKIAIAVPLLREDLQASLLLLAWVAGAYSILGVAGGVLTGYAVGYFPLRRVVVAGLVLIGAGSFAGAFAQGPSLLIATRVVEGIGFLGLAVACPALLRQATAPRHLPMVLAAWAAYVPAGGAIMLFLGPGIMSGDWRTLWLASGAAALVNALLLVATRPAAGRQAAGASHPGRSDVKAMVTAPAPLLLASVFALHGIQFFALATFLPVLAVDRLGLTLATAGTISATAFAGAAIGNIAGGFLRRTDVPAAHVVGFAFCVVALTGPVVFAEGMPTAAVVAAAGACFALTGLLPSTVISSMPQFAPTPQRMALGMGMIQQASSIAAVAGPVAIASWVQLAGWSSAGWLFVFIGVCGGTAAFMLSRAMRG